MKLKTRLFKTTALVATCLLGIGVARAEVQMNQLIPYNETMDIVCDGAVQDTLQLSGMLHALMTRTMSHAGVVVTTFHFQPVNFSAVGQLTGDTYRVPGVTRQTVVTTQGEVVVKTFVNNFYLIGQQSGIKYLFKQVFHVTIVDGQAVVTIDTSEIRCL